MTNSSFADVTKMVLNLLGVRTPSTSATAASALSQAWRTEIIQETACGTVLSAGLSNQAILEKIQVLEDMFEGCVRLLSFTEPVQH